MREREFYRDNLAAVLEFTGGIHLLSVTDVKHYTGIVDDRTAKKRYPFDEHNCISAETFARCLSKGEKREY